MYKRQIVYSVSIVNGILSRFCTVLNCHFPSLLINIGMGHFGGICFEMNDCDIEVTNTSEEKNIYIFAKFLVT